MMRLFEGTEWDRPPRCDRCEALESECQCPPEQAAVTYRAPSKQTAALRVENRKRGKQVVVVRGLSAIESDLPSLLAQIKSSCGVGGTVKAETLEIQGNQIERVREVLARLGYRCQ